MKKNFDEYRVALEGVWNGKNDMVDYCVKNTDNVVKLDNGWLIPIEKEHIKKDFCFGYSLSRYDSEDYDRANEMASHARNSADYFFAENMKGFDALMDALNDKDVYAVVNTKYYTDKDGTIKDVHFLKGWEICDMFGGSCYMSEVGGKTAEYRGLERYVLTDADVAKVKDGVAEARKNHEKRVRTYLKKYGTKHVNSWSYWQDV